MMKQRDGEALALLPPAPTGLGGGCNLHSTSPSYTLHCYPAPSTSSLHPHPASPIPILHPRSHPAPLCRILYLHPTLQPCTPNPHHHLTRCLHPCLHPCPHHAPALPARGAVLGELGQGQPRSHPSPTLGPPAQHPERQGGPCKRWCCCRTGGGCSPGAPPPPRLAGSPRCRQPWGLEERVGF